MPIAEQAEKRDAEERIIEIELERLRSFNKHPFKVQADSQMIELQESIKSLEKVNIFITEENLDAMVLQTIQGIASQLISEKSFLEKIKNEFLRRKEVAETGLKELSMKKDLSEAAIARLYERYAIGSLDKAKYIMLKEDESRKHASCNLRRSAVADAFSSGRPAVANGC